MTQPPKIDKNIPIPEVQNSNGTSATMRKLKIGDSFLSIGQRASLYPSASYVGIKIAVRKEGDKFRVWRTK